ncbi:MAG TPA: type II toxin-antitoxin system HicB family antitoxin [Candidatus Binataceae bacterium]|nr:type II toxin-antitoxin system HicB family antitoxin [Candidatus Binataceae bacterium]
MRYVATIEKADGNYSAYISDLPGCIATGATVKEVQQRIARAIRLHIEALELEHLPVPEPVQVRLRSTTAPLTKKEILRLRKWFGGLAIAIGIAYFLFGLIAFIVPRLDDRPLTMVGVGLAIWIGGRCLQHSALAQQTMDRIEHKLAWEAGSVSATVEPGKEAGSEGADFK